jgi:hypothetical protein
MEGSYGNALDLLESCCFEGRECSCGDEKDVWLQQNYGAPGLFLLPNAKISREEH